ncbi:hypothetical protein BHE74_00003978 [Ensete ventricosum]|nr:hypothetical protein BHE74_00003978 [Ensete ventricosum]
MVPCVSSHGNEMTSRLLAGGRSVASSSSGGRDDTSFSYARTRLRLVFPRGDEAPPHLLMTDEAPPRCVNAAAMTAAESGVMSAAVLDAENGSGVAEIGGPPGETASLDSDGKIVDLLQRKVEGCLLTVHHLVASGM